MSLDDLRSLRAGLHEDAYYLHSRGRSEAAQALWSVVERLDLIINDIENRGA